MTSFKGRRTDDDRAFDDRVGERIRAHRLAAGLTQSELARRSGVTFQQIQKYELGVNRVAASRLFAISTAMGAPMSALLGEGEAEPEPVAGLRRLTRAYEGCSEPRRAVLIALAEVWSEGGEGLDASDD